MSVDRRRTSRHGVGLMEAVVALAVVSLVAVAALQVAAAEARFARSAADALYASVLTQEATARLKTLPAAQLVEGDATERTFGPSLPEWRWSATLTPVETATTPGLHDLVITVRGPRRSFETHSRIFVEESVR